MSLRHIIWLVILRLSPRESQRPRHTRQCRRHSWCGPVHGVRDLKRVVQNHIGDDGHTISCIDAREQLSGFRHRAPRVPWHCTLLETCFLKLAHLSPYRTLGRRRTAARRKRGCITFFFPKPPTITFRSIASTARVFRLPPVISSGKRHCFRSVASAFSPSAFVVASRQRLLALRPHSACNCFAKLGVIGTYNSPYFPVVSGFPVHVAPLQEDMIQKSIWLLDFGDGANPT